MIKNNVTRFLTSKRIAFDTFESEPVKRSALEMAERFNLDPMIVYKSIVCFNPVKEKYLLCMIPGPYEVNLKKLAMAVGEKKTMVVTQKEAETLTGLEAGGISPFMLINKGFQFWVQETVLKQDKISVSGGQRGLSIFLKSEDFLKVINPRIADIADLQQADK